MLLFSDSHHSGLLRSLFLLFRVRLKHDIYFPDPSFCDWANTQIAGAWLPPNIRGCGGIPDDYLSEHGEIRTQISREVFLSLDWDAVLITRIESQGFFEELIRDHPSGKKIKIIGQAGNDGTEYNWEFVKNFLSSDYLSFMRCPHTVNSIHYMQEVGEQFRPQRFVQLTEESLKGVNTYINCLQTFGKRKLNHDYSLWNESCPHCDSRGSGDFEVNVNGIWDGMKPILPSHTFRDYGIDNSYGMASERDMPAIINNSSLTWGYKTYEGFGHSISQSISMGRLCIVPRRFHRYRTANQFLIPNLTCLEADWSEVNCAQVIREFTQDLDTANEYSLACFRAAKGLFNWEHEAARVATFLDKLQ